MGSVEEETTSEVHAKELLYLFPVDLPVSVEFEDFLVHLYLHSGEEEEEEVVRQGRLTCSLTSIV